MVAPTDVDPLAVPPPAPLTVPTTVALVVLASPVTLVVVSVVVVEATLPTVVTDVVLPALVELPVLEVWAAPVVAGPPVVGPDAVSEAVEPAVVSTALVPSFSPQAKSTGTSPSKAHLCIRPFYTRRKTAPNDCSDSGTTPGKSAAGRASAHCVVVTLATGKST